MAIDVDLFANAYAKGMELGHKVKSPFASFTDSFIEGLSNAADYETKILQNEIRRNQIEMQPVENEIRTAEAKIKQKQVEQLDSEDYDKKLELDKAKLDNALAEEERKARIIQQRDAFMSIMQSDDGVAKGQALMSGEYEEFLSTDPKLKPYFIQNSFSSWGENERTVYNDRRKAERAKKTYEQLLPEAEKENVKNLAAFNNNQELSVLRNKMGNIAVADMLEGAKISFNMEPESIPVVDKDGKTTYRTDPTKPLKKAYKLEYGGELYDISKDTAELYSKTKNNYDIINGLSKYQNGDGDLNRKAEDVKKKENELKAQAEEQANQTEQEVQKGRQAFFSSFEESVNKTPYKQEFQELKQAMTTPAGTPVPQRTPTPTGTPTPNIVPTSPNIASTSPTGSSPGVPAPSGTPSSWINNPKARESAAAAKARLRFQKLGKQVQAPSATPSAQMSTVTEPDYKPASMQVRTPFRPDPTVIQKVSTIPELQNTSAMFKAVVAQESTGNANAVSPTGVVGLAQLTENALKDMGLQGVDRTDPVISALAGSMYLDKLNNTFPENPMLALVAYNGGPGVAKEAIRMARTSDWETVKKYIPMAVMKYSQYWKDKGIDPQQKSKEVLDYAEKVVANFPAFVNTRSDLAMAEKLKRQGVLEF